MSLAVYFDALISSLKRELEWFNDNGLLLKLFTNDLDPNSDTEIDEFEEPTADWYDPPTLDEWDPDAVTYTAPRAVANHPIKTFEPDGITSITVYGYFVVDGMGNLLWSERFEEPPLTVGPSPTQSLGITPQYTRRSEFHST